LQEPESTTLIEVKAGEVLDTFSGVSIEFDLYTSNKFNVPSKPSTMSTLVNSNPSIEALLEKPHQLTLPLTRLLVMIIGDGDGAKNKGGHKKILSTV